MFISIRSGTDWGVPGAIRVPARSSTQPSSPPPPTPSSRQDRLPLRLPSSGGVREIRPIHPGSRWSSSSDAEPQWPPQVNPFQPSGDRRPQQLVPGSSPPAPQNLSELVSSPTQHHTRGYPSRPSTAGGSDYRPDTPTPTPEQRSIQESRQSIRDSGMLFGSEQAQVNNPNATLGYLRSMEQIVRSRIARAKQFESEREEGRRAAEAPPRRRGRR